VLRFFCLKKVGGVMQAQKDAQMAKFLNARYAPHVEQERQSTAVSVYMCT
jgi:L-alanine-DL-glutamate epimerase-like enolase superfamily enzyme